jgi:hypothetical protein
VDAAWQAGHQDGWYPCGGTSARIDCDEPRRWYVGASQPGQDLGFFLHPFCGAIWSAVRPTANYQGLPVSDAILHDDSVHRCRDTSDESPHRDDARASADD